MFLLLDQIKVHRTLRIRKCNSNDKIIIINENLVLKQILSCQRKAYSIPTSVILLMLLHASSLYVVERKINDKSFILHHQSQRYDKCFHLSIWHSCKVTCTLTFYGTHFYNYERYHNFSIMIWKCLIMKLKNIFSLIILTNNW